MEYKADPDYNVRRWHLDCEDKHRRTPRRACLKSRAVYANMSDLESVWLAEPVPEVSAVKPAVGLRHPGSLFSMVMYEDAGTGTFCCFPLALFLSPRH